MTQLSRGGVEAKLASVLPLLARRGFDVGVCCIKQRGPLAETLEAAGIPVLVCPVKSRLSPSGIFRLASFLRRRRVDIVHTHMYAANITGTLAARIASAPVVVSNVHNVGKFRSRRQVLTERLVSRFRDATVCVSEAVKKDYISTTKLDETNVYVIYNGVDVSRFKPRDATSIRRRLGFAPGEKVLVFAGRLIPQKSPELALEAFAVICKVLPGTRLLILGRGHLLQSLSAKAKSLGLGDKVVFAGYREDVEHFLSAADLFISSSTKEGFSNVLLEALASGLPAVVTDVGGNREAIRHGKEGFLCKPHARSLGQAALRILRDPVLCAKMRVMARARALEFDVDHMAEQTACLYTSLLKAKRERSKRA